MGDFDYDLLVIGCGPGGQKAAIAAAKLGRRAAVIEKRDVVGGVCVNTGTIPSKSLREAVLYLTGLSQRDLYGQSYRVKEDITMEDLSRRTHHVVGREIEVVRDQLSRNRVALLQGTGQFVDEHTIAVRTGTGDRRLSADKVIIAVGHAPRPAGERGIRRRPHLRLRRHPGAPRDPPDARDRRGRRHRHRVRLDLCRPRHQGNGDRTARPNARVL